MIAWIQSDGTHKLDQSQKELANCIRDSRSVFLTETAHQTAVLSSFHGQTHNLIIERTEQSQSIQAISFQAISSQSKSQHEATDAKLALLVAEMAM